MTCQDPMATNVGGPLPCVFPPPPPLREIWTLILGTAAGPRIEQLRIEDVPQDRYRICGGGASGLCRELMLKP
jgi:hypothetical protein